MEGCLLCLQLKKQFVDTIVINSNQWNELNIKMLLDKYLWPMNHIDTNSWICTTCWNELYEFHKFYISLKELHRNFGLVASISEIDESVPNKAEDFICQVAESQICDVEGISNDVLEEIPVDELKEFLNESVLSDDHLQKDSMIDLKPLIKNEINEETLTERNLLTHKRSRGRPRKGASNNSSKNYEKLKGKDDCRIKSKKTKKIKQNKDKGILSNATSNAYNSGKNRAKNLLTPSENNPLSHEYNDSQNDSDREFLDNNLNKSNANTYCPPKINHNEKDKFLAENFKITCFLCNIPFETFFNMRKHFDEHHTERGHVKCCNKKFYRRSILVDHVHYHLNPNYFKCSQCGKVMADRRCLELHVEIHDNNQEKSHCCDICGKAFAKFGVLKKHRMIHLSEEEKRFACSDCGKNFASNYLLSSHYRSVHLKKYAKICDICGKSIRSKDVFERHMLQHEGKTAPSVSCDICGLVLTDKKALKRHKDIIHPVGGQHEYTCSICSKTSPNLRAHKRHVQYKHVMGYDYKCTICDKAFKRAPTLKEHMASHTGTILYTCPWCPKTFNSNANMHNHRKRVHPKEWEEASRKRYSGNLPPNYKPPNIIDPTDYAVPMGT